MVDLFLRGKKLINLLQCEVYLVKQDPSLFQGGTESSVSWQVNNGDQIEQVLTIMWKGNLKNTVNRSIQMISLYK